MQKRISASNLIYCKEDRVEFVVLPLEVRLHPNQRSPAVLNMTLWAGGCLQQLLMKSKGETQNKAKIIMRRNYQLVMTLDRVASFPTSVTTYGLIIQMGVTYNLDLKQLIKTL